jgi:hypothetical protein
MNLADIFKKTSFRENHILEMYIGRNLSKSSFSINNKIFFDVFFSYLQKNDWVSKAQYISKKFYLEDFILESTLKKSTEVDKEKETYLGLSIPFEFNQIIYKKCNEILKKFKGTYYDIFTTYYQNQTIPLDNINFNKVYNEIIEETTVLFKKDSLFDIYFIIEKANNAEKTNISYFVKLVFNTNPNLDILNEVIDIMDLAMAKYKKTDKTITSVFTVLA